MNGNPSSLRNEWGGISLTLRSGCCRDSRGRDTARYCRLSPKSVKPMREMLPCGPVTFLIKDGDTLKDANKLKQKWKLDDSRFSPPPSATAAVWQSRVLACTLVQFFHWRKRCKKSVHWHERHFINSLKLWRELQGSSSFLKWGGPESRGSGVGEAGNWIPLRCVMCSERIMSFNASR